MTANIESRVCQDIADRHALGISRHWQPEGEDVLTLRQRLNRAYEETLDQAVELKRALEQLDEPPALETLEVIDDE